MDQPVFFSDDEREETIIERRERERQNGAGRAENEEHIPLIPNVKADQRKTITHLEIWKLNPPGDGFKGKVPPTATAETIARLYGDGTYDIHAIAADGKTLRRNTGVKVAWVNPDASEPSTKIPAPHDKEMSLLDWQSQQHDRAAARTEAFGRMVVDSVRTSASEQLTAQAKAHEMQMTRDREFMSSMLANQQLWAQSMMQQTSLSHQQAMERSEQNFRQAMEAMRISHERQLQASNPNAHLRIFQEAMQFMGAMGMLGSGEDEPEDDKTPWVAAIEAAGSAIGDITDAYKTKMKADASGAPKLASPAPASKPAGEKGPPSPVRTTKRKGPFTRDDVAALVQMKVALEKQGIPFSQAIQYARENLVGRGPGDNGVSKTGDSGGDSQESNSETGEADVGSD